MSRDFGEPVEATVSNYKQAGHDPIAQTSV